MTWTAIFNLLWKVANMPPTFLGQLTIVSVGLGILVILWKAKKGYDAHMLEENQRRAEDALHREWIEELWLEYCRSHGLRVSDTLIRKHMMINGNSQRSAAEKDRIYGIDRPRGEDSGDLKANRKASGE